MIILPLRTNALTELTGEPLPYSVYTVGTEEQYPMTRSKGFSAHQLFATFSGKGRFRLLGRTKWDIVDSGKVLFVPAHAPHEYVSEGYEPWKIGFVSFSSPPEALRAWSLGDEAALIGVGNTERMFELIESIWQLSGPAQHYWRASELLLAFLCELGRQRHAGANADRMPDRPPAEASGANAVVEAASRFLRDHLNRRTTTITGLAEHLGYSRKHLTRLFLTAYATTPLQYLKTLRLESAARHLRIRPNAPVADIAAQVGMEPAYFARAFRAAFGVAPNDYRRLSATPFDD
ncbi:AraC family transcriptional regulator [Cohnella sp. GCM10027633]|uniref:helix-turn-helix transcriptional regulator n=1 Tax=unclassified Cohnella TaxID=2636738 RepID=UPI00362E1113